MMNTQNAINEINALVANSEVNDAVAEKLLAIAYWLEFEQLRRREDCELLIRDIQQIYSENNPE